MLAEAIRIQDVRLLAHVATAGAEINERFLPKPMFQEIRTLVKRAGGLGVATAHTGTILSALLDPEDPAIEKRVDILQRLGSSSGH
jgi:L-threonine kinase